MKTPQPTPVAGGKKTLVVVPGITRRDIIVAICIVLAIVGFICLAVFSLDKKPKNTLSGIVKGRYSTGERETLLNVSTRGVKGKTVDTGYYLKVYVPDDKQTYNVIVEKELWEQKKDGDSLDFLKPEAEQTY